MAKKRKKAATAAKRTKKVKKKTKGKAAAKSTKTKKKKAKKKNSLVANINRRKKAGKSRSKSRSTISDDSYEAMQEGWPKKKKKKVSK